MKNVIFIPCPSQPDMKTAAETAAERLLEISVVPELYCGTAVYNGAPENGAPGIILIFPDGCDEDARKAGREFSSQLCTEFCTVGQPSSLTIGSAGNNQLENRQRPLRRAQNSRCPLLVLSGSGKDYGIGNSNHSRYRCRRDMAGTSHGLLSAFLFQRTGIFGLKPNLKKAGIFPAFFMGIILPDYADYGCFSGILALRLKS